VVSNLNTSCPDEVKVLAKQTAKASEEISRQITAIQEDTKGAVDAIRPSSRDRVALRLHRVAAAPRRAG
jgi:methyl-accepting chemotaxis protein